MSQYAIDLNADLGESYGPWTMGADAEMLQIVTSANVACGFHAGDPMVMTQTARLCRRHGVVLGAHPGFDDKQGFGRRRILDIPEEALRAMIIYQIGALQAIARAESVAVRYVKPHGALNNMASADPAMARTCVEATQAADPNLVILATAATDLEVAAVAAGAPLTREVFADRAYLDDGRLVPRRQPGAVLHDPEAAADRVLRMIDERALTSINGVKIPVTPESICVHGDSPDAVRMAHGVRTRLEAAGVAVRAFCADPEDTAPA